MRTVRRRSGRGSLSARAHAVLMHRLHPRSKRPYQIGRKPFIRLPPIQEAGAGIHDNLTQAQSACDQLRMEEIPLGLRLFLRVHAFHRNLYQHLSDQGHRQQSGRDGFQHAAGGGSAFCHADGGVADPQTLRAVLPAARTVAVPHRVCGPGRSGRKGRAAHSADFRVDFRCQRLLFHDLRPAAPRLRH